MTETFELLTERPAQHDCPNCPCCTAELCDRGRTTIHRCAGLTPDEMRATVNNCPCSAAWTRGTHAWRQERIRVTQYATERPFPAVEETALRQLAEGEQTRNGTALARLRVAGMAAEEAGHYVITDSGRLYLEVRADHRFMTPVEVLSVDTRLRTAEVIVIGWHLAQPVTVLLDQLIADTLVMPAELPGMFLEAEANCRAEDPQDLVLTRVIVAPPLPDGFLGTVRDEQAAAVGQAAEPAALVFAPGTNAWRGEQARVTRIAREQPLPDEVEAALRELVDTGEAQDAEALHTLRITGLAVFTPGGRTVPTASGRLYLTARTDHRILTAVHVMSVNLTERTANVDVVGWRGEDDVIMALDPLMATTGLSADELRGTRLVAEVNGFTAAVEDVVLTAVRVPPVEDAADVDEDAGGEEA